MIKSPEENGDDDKRLLGGGPIHAPDCGQRLDRYLAGRYPFFSRSGWQKRIDLNEVLVNAHTVRASYVLKQGDQLVWLQPEELEPEVCRDVRMLWREGAVMAVLKPANLPMHANGPYCKNTLVHILRTEFGSEWAFVHRLDMETSGIVLCAATYQTRKDLSLDFACGRITKEYRAIVNGVPIHDAWQEHGAIGRLDASSIRIKKWVVDNGAPAETRFTVLERKSAYALLRAQPKTGRTHQIRVHCAVKGHPIVGDKLYHPDEGVFQDYFDNGNTQEVIEKTGFFRLCLHAAQLEFTHPETGKRCELSAPLPQELQILWQDLT